MNFAQKLAVLHLFKCIFYLGKKRASLIFRNAPKVAGGGKTSDIILASCLLVWISSVA